MNFSPNKGNSAIRGSQIEHVTSPANATVKLLKGLDRKRERTESGLFLAEGARLVQEGLDRGWTPRHVLVGQEAMDRPQVTSILTRAVALGARVLTTSPRILSSISRKDNPQTIVAAFDQRLDGLSRLVVSQRPRFVALYEVRDPGNLGTILRTADAAGVDGVILTGRCCDPYSVECVRATMGSIFAMAPVQAETPDLFAWAQAHGLSVAAASVNGRQRHDQATYGAGSVLLMGNEQAGIPPDIEAQCDILVRIPMMGAADSLNLAQATGVMIYEIWRQDGYDGADR